MSLQSAFEIVTWDWQHGGHYADPEAALEEARAATRREWLDSHDEEKAWAAGYAVLCALQCDPENCPHCAEDMNILWLARGF